MFTIKIKDDTFREVFKKHNNGSLECNDTNLGEIIAWLMLNRPPIVEIEIRHPTSSIFLPRTIVNVTVPEHKEADARTCVEIFHLH